MARLSTRLLLAAVLFCGAAAALAEDLPHHRHPGYVSERSMYGYRPYRPWVGPIRARYELDEYVYNPRKAGVDYSWGIGYFFGHGPGDKTYQAARPR